MGQALATWVTKALRSSSLPIAEPPPVGGHTGATSEPTTNPLADLSASRFNVIADVDVYVRVVQEQVDTIELDAVTYASR